MKEKLKNNKIEIIIILVLLIVLSSTILLKKFGSLDEIWNYNLSRNIAEGKIAYRDINIVQLPGFFMLTAIFLKIWNELIVTRILGILLSTGIMFLTYKMLKELGVNKYVAGIFVAGITYMLLDYFCLDYNFFNLLIILLIMFIENKNFEKHELKINLLIGILGAFSFLVKQTTGGFVMLAAILLKLLQIKKENYKQIFKEILVRCVGVLIPIIMFVMYLTINGAWQDFVDYAILGMFTFGNKISYLNLIKSNNLHIKLLSIIVPSYFIGLIIWSVIKKDKTLILMLYSIVAFIVVYPISDNIHFLIGAIPAIIGIIYFIYLGVYELIKKHKKCVLFFKYMLVAVLGLIYIWATALYGVKLIKNIKEIGKYNELEHFKYIPISEKLKNRIKNVDEYILNNNKKVYILDATAAIYMIPINIYNKDYDMFLKGNIGGKGEQGQIEKIKNMKNAYLLIKHNANDRNWQTPTEVIEYVENNLKKVDTIESFDVYDPLGSGTIGSKLE